MMPHMRMLARQVEATVGIDPDAGARYA